MTHDLISDHIDFEVLSDFADESLGEADRKRVVAHLAVCDDCSVRLAKLRHLLAAVSALPAEIDPPADLWQDVRARLDTASTEGIPASSVEPGRREGALAHWLVRRPWLLAAAAVVLVVASSLITASVVRRQDLLRVSDTTPLRPAALVLPAAARAIDADYARTVSELATALAAQRDRLDPATIAKVEESLRVIDTAIAEARDALARDPANLTLLDILSANYERKLELLRRASELSSTI